MAFSFEFPIFNSLPCRIRSRTTFLHGGQATEVSQSRKLFCILQLQNDPSFFRLRNRRTGTVRFVSATSNQPSFTVSYLVDKLGFYPESALRASNRLHLKSPDNADTVISFLENHGFSKSQIKTMVKRKPTLLTSDVEKTFSPKLKFFLSKGFSSPELTTLLYHHPTILLTSLERQIIPFFNAYSNLIHSDENTIKAIRKHPRLIEYDMDFIISNINILRDHGIPESNIIKTLYQHPGAVLVNSCRLKETLEEVEEIGLDPLEFKFVTAVNVLATMSKSTRERKVDSLKKWGWSEKQILECLRKYPLCFKVSEGMIMSKMDFLVNKLGIKASLVANQPSVLTRSLSKRIIPRGLFAQHLLSKGLIEHFTLSTLFDTSEEYFLKRFVTCHGAPAPELLKLYKSKMKISFDIEIFQKKDDSP